LAALLRNYPEVRRLNVEDGKGRPLGRSFGVKLWPTLVFLRDGKVVAQAVRPAANEIRQGLEAVTAGGAGGPKPEGAGFPEGGA
jgi:thioredoxin 1